MKRTFWPSHRAKLGQHFLVDAAVRRRIVDKMQPEPTDVVVEIGAGRGFLTEVLAGRVEKLWAIELDPRWAMTLKAGFINSRAVTVVEGDVLQMDFHQFLSPGDVGKRLRLVGNLPYYITSPILFRLFEFADLIRDATLMAQKEVVERLVATPTHKDYGHLSLATQFYSDPEFLFSVLPAAFSPRPQVHSSVVRLTMKSRARELQIDDPAAFLRFAQRIFVEKRKTLLNNLRRMIPQNSPGMHLKLEEQLVECGLDPRVRAENVPLPLTARLYRTLRLHGFL